MKWRRVRRFNWMAVPGKGNGYRLKAGMTEWESCPATPLGPCMRRDDGEGNLGPECNANANVPRRDDVRRPAGDDIGCWSLQAAFVRREYTRAACTPTPLRSTTSASKVPVNAIFFFISHLLRFWLWSSPALGVSRSGIANAVWPGCS